MTQGWGFSRANRRGEWSGGDPTKYALDKEISVFTREVLQNANDQGPEEDGPVEVTFRLNPLSGDDLDQFKEAIDWDELHEHLETVADMDNGGGYQRYLNRIEEEDELLLLTVEDRNTTGLIGSDDDENSNFRALVRDVLFSSKPDDSTSGGSYGLGKAVLWAFSGVSTVLFNSQLAKDPEDYESPRLIARTRLPTHRSQDGDIIYQGPGWFGHFNDKEEDEIPRSIWGDETEDLAEALHVERPGVSGTSATVVGFRDPTAEEQPEVNELAEEILEASVKYFWPAIHFGDLEVSVETPDGIREADIDEVPAVHPFVECVDEPVNADAELDDPGDVASRKIPLEIPDEYDGDPTEDGSVTLSVRLADPDDDEELVNKVAFFRGAGMVVKYWDRDRVVLGDRDFYAALVCGRARAWGNGDPTDADQDIEKFLRAAEPPEHDTWTSTENLKNGYKRGGPTTVSGLHNDVTEKLRKLVQQSRSRGKLGPKRLAKRFPIGRGSPQGSVSPTPERVINGDTTVEFSADTDRWEFSGYLEPTVDEHRGWFATVALRRMAEDGPTEDFIPVVSIQPDDLSVSHGTNDGKGNLDADESTDGIKFEGYSEADPREGETRLEIEGTLQLGGDD
jgi:hypothetical protein